MNCFEQEVPIYETTHYPGSFDDINGRQASESFDMHTLTLGLNYRF